MPFADSSPRSEIIPSLASASIWARLQYPLVAAILLIFGVAGWRGREPTMIAGGDELDYLALSHSLQGGSYREIFRQGAPIHVKYPPGYPAWLVVVRQVVGENLDLIRLTNLALAGLAIVLMYSTARRLMGVPLALALLLLLGTNPGLLQVSGSLLSESLFLLLTTTALVLTFTAEPTERPGAPAVIALALAAFLTRSVGVALLLAIGGWLWFPRRRGTSAAWAIVSLLVVGGWFTFTTVARANSTVRSYLGDMVGQGAHSHLNPILSLVRQAGSHTVTYSTLGLLNSLTLPTIRGTVADNLAWLGLLVVLLPTGILVLWRSWRPAAVYLVLSATILVLYPWVDTRLLIPLVPLIFLAFLLGARQAAGLLPVPARGPALIALVILLALGSIPGAAHRVNLYRGCDRANPYTSPGCYNDTTRSTVVGAEYLRRNALPADVVLTDKPSSLAFLSGHLTEHSSVITSAPEGTVADTLRARGIRFVLFRPSPTGLGPALLGSCRDLRVEASFGSGVLLLSTTQSSPPASDACNALSALVPLDHR